MRGGRSHCYVRLRGGSSALVVVSQRSKSEQTFRTPRQFGRRIWSFYLSPFLAIPHLYVRCEVDVYIAMSDCEVEVQRLSAGIPAVGSGEKERENAQPFIVRNLVDFEEVDVAVTPKQRGETARLSREALIDRASFGVDQLHMICVSNGHCPSLQIWHNYTLTQRMMWALSFSVGEIFRPQALPGVGKGLGLDTLYSL